MSAKRLVIGGRVQGVGYRAWAAQAANALGLAGWVRNLADGRVELVLDGPVDAVEQMQRDCRRGPRLAEVETIEETLVPPCPGPGFTILGTL